MKKTYQNKKKLKRIFSKCEIEGCEETDVLECHHIIPQNEQNSNKNFSHSWMNLAIVCPNHHAKIERGDIIIEGRFKSTEGYTLIYHKKTQHT